MFLFFKGFQLQNVLILFLFSLIHSYPLTAEITPAVNNWGYFLNPLQNGPFRGCLQMGDKKAPSLTSVTHIVQ